MSCISTTCFSVLANDSPRKTFKPSRGIHQGDPVAPYIFVLAMEYVARLLQLESEKNKSKVGIKLTPRSTNPPYLSLVNDKIIFAPTNNESIDKIKVILLDLSQVYKLKINFQKSSLQVSANISQNTAKSLSTRMNVPMTKYLEKYLGILLSEEESAIDTFNNAVDNLKK